MNQEAQAICLIVAQVAQLRPGLCPGAIARNVSKIYRLAWSIEKDTTLTELTAQGRKLASELDGEFILKPSEFWECECVLKLDNTELKLTGE